jgi:hypothetical protein
MKIEFEDQEPLEAFELMEIIKELLEKEGPVRHAFAKALLEVLMGFVRDVPMDDESRQIALNRGVRECFQKYLCIGKN